jgi:hypothetical protein
MIRNLMIGCASVEDTLSLWATALREGKRRIRPLFTHERAAASAETWSQKSGSGATVRCPSSDRRTVVGNEDDEVIQRTRTSHR